LKKFAWQIFLGRLAAAWASSGSSASVEYEYKVLSARIKRI
jgi:hypothetical protein